MFFPTCNRLLPAMTSYAMLMVNAHAGGKIDERNKFIFTFFIFDQKKIKKETKFWEENKIYISSLKLRESVRNF